MSVCMCLFAIVVIHTRIYLDRCIWECSIHCIWMILIGQPILLSRPQLIVLQSHIVRLINSQSPQANHTPHNLIQYFFLTIKIKHIADHRKFVVIAVRFIFPIDNSTFTKKKIRRECTVQKANLLFELVSQNRLLWEDTVCHTYSLSGLSTTSELCFLYRTVLARANRVYLRITKIFLCVEMMWCVYTVHPK